MNRHKNAKLDKFSSRERNLLYHNILMNDHVHVHVLTYVCI